MQFVKMMRPPLQTIPLWTTWEVKEQMARWRDRKPRRLRGCRSGSGRRRRGRDAGMHPTLVAFLQTFVDRDKLLCQS